jgi:hypothetical protein
MLTHDSCGFCDTFRYDVVHHNVGTVLCEDCGMGASHPTAGAGNQRYAAL